MVDRFDTDEPRQPVPSWEFGESILILDLFSQYMKNYFMI